MKVRGNDGQWVEVNAFDAARTMQAEARHVFAAAERMAAQLAPFLPGRLRHVDPEVLKELKTELRDFNAHTGKWKP